MTKRKDVCKINGVLFPGEEVLTKVSIWQRYRMTNSPKSQPYHGINLAKLIAVSVLRVMMRGYGQRSCVEMA